LSNYRAAGLPWTSSVSIVDGRIYLPAGKDGLIIVPTLGNLQFSVRLDATPGIPFALEAATKAHGPISWTPLLITNVPAMPFDYVDLDVKLSDKLASSTAPASRSLEFLLVFPSDGILVLSRHEASRAGAAPCSFLLLCHEELV